MSHTQRIIVLSPDPIRFRAVCTLLLIDPSAEHVIHVDDDKGLAQLAELGYHLVIDRVERNAQGRPLPGDEGVFIEEADVRAYVEATKLAKAHRRNQFMERTTWVDLDAGAFRCHTRLASELVDKRKELK